jgi:hypothetical protein
MKSDLAGRMTGDRRWHEIGQKINMALVMINSGVPQETTFHLTQALTRVTRIGGQAASVLKGKQPFLSRSRHIRPYPARQRQCWVRSDQQWIPYWRRTNQRHER